MVSEQERELFTQEDAEHCGEMIEDEDPEVAHPEVFQAVQGGQTGNAKD